MPCIPLSIDAVPVPSAPAPLVDEQLRQQVLEDTFREIFGRRPTPAGNEDPS